MLKKMMLLALSACALVAFAIPAAAQAVQLTDEGETVPKGTKVTATSTNLKTTTLAGTLECAKVTIHGTVLDPGPTQVVIGETVTTTEGCNALITNPTAGTITINSGTGTATGASFTADLGGGVQCTIAGNLGFTYTSGTDVLNIPGSTLTNSCGGTGNMHGSFTLETPEGETPIEIDA